MADTVKSSSTGVISFITPEDDGTIFKITVPEVNPTEFTRTNINALISATASVSGGVFFTDSNGNKIPTTSTSYNGSYIEDKTLLYLDLT